MISDMKDGVYDFTDNGKCTNCGQCCSDILPVSGSEIKTIKNYIRKHKIQEQKHFAPVAEYFDFTCPFRNNLEKKCVIYEVRPLICRCFKCDNPKNKIESDKKVYRRKNNVVSMRETFFGKE